MRVLRVAMIAASVMLLAQTSWAAAQKYTWDGNGGGAGQKCSSYQFHLEMEVDNGKASGWWQQKGRDVRKFELPLKGDGTFAGEVTISNGNIVYVKGKTGDSPVLEATGYCDFGGPLKKQ